MPRARKLSRLRAGSLHHPRKTSIFFAGKICYALAAARLASTEKAARVKIEAISRR